MKSSQSNHSVGPRRGNTSNLLNSSRQLDRLARNCGFLKRQSGKLTPKRFVNSLVASACSAQHSLRQVAFEIGLQLQDDTYSKQALWERIDGNAVDFIKGVAGKVIKLSADSITPLHLKSLPGVRRVLVGDSSTWNFHPSLREYFPGATNQHGVKCAQNHFQFTHDLLSGKWLQARSDPYQRNDRSAAADIVESLVQAGDLIIRDLGYAVTSVFESIAQKGAFFLSRLNTTAAVYDEEGQRVDLLELARRETPRAGDEISMTVYLSQKHRLKCRLVLRHEGEAVGNTRRRRLRDSGKRQGINHRKDYLRLQDWTLMVTNLDEQSADESQVCELYRLRWRIENLFKVAKSQTALKKLLTHRSNPHHIELLMWSWVLAMVHLGMCGVFAVAELKIERGLVSQVAPVERSVFKAMERLLWLAALSIELAAAGSLEELRRRFIAQSDYHDRYECRRQRITLPQRMAKIFIDTSLQESLT